VKDCLAWPGRPHFPCRHLLLHGFGYLLDERVEWHEPNRRLTQLQAILVERGIARVRFSTSTRSYGPWRSGILAPQEIRRVQGASPGPWLD
jgi:hypothetical protein